MRKSNWVLIFFVFALMVASGLLRQGESMAQPFAPQTGDADIDLLIKTAKSDPNADARKEALAALAKKVCEQGTQLLGESDEHTDALTQKQKYEVLALSKRPRDEAIPQLIEVAKTHPKAVIRRHAVYYLGQSGDERALNFFEALFIKSRKRD